MSWRKGGDSLKRRRRILTRKSNGEFEPSFIYLFFNFPAVVIPFYMWHFIRLYNKAYIHTAETCLI